MAGKTYYEKLRDPRWQKRRLEIMNRADFSCENCGAKDITLHVHHRRYQKGAEPWGYPDSELICLCENCHEAEHLAREELTALLAQFYASDIDRLIGYAKSILLERYWEDDEAGRKSIPVRNDEQACGLAAGIGVIPGLDPEYSQILQASVPVMDLLSLEVTMHDRRRGAPT